MTTSTQTAGPIAGLIAASQIVNERHSDDTPRTDFPEITVRLTRYWEILTNGEETVAAAENIARRGQRVNVHLRFAVDRNHLLLGDFGGSVLLRSHMLAVQCDDLQNALGHGLIAGVPGGGKSSAANLCRIPRTWRLRRVLRAATRIARNGLAAWARGTASVTWLAVAGTAGLWIGLANMAEFDRLVVSRPHPMLWALDQIEQNRFTLLTAWTALGLLAAVHAWSTSRATLAAGQPDTDGQHDLTDQIDSLTATVADLDGTLREVITTVNTLAQQLNDQHGGAA